MLLLLLLACSPNSKVTPVDTAALAGVGTARLQGKVWTVDGDPVVGAIVSVGARRTATNAHGFFLLEGLPPGEAVISAAADGYSSTAAVRTLPEVAWGYVDLRLKPAEILSWDPTEGGLLETAEGVELDLGALQDALGEEVSGPVSVSVSLLNTTHDVAAAPGALMATREGQDALLESLGMIEVRLTDESGLPVQLAEPAEISFPVADLDDQEGFGLFGYDEETGRWQEVGGGEVGDGRFQVEVEHFSWWNCDRFANTDQCVTGTLKAGGEVVTGATITVFEEESLTSGSFETDEDGRFTIDLPAGQDLWLSLDYGAYTWESDLIALPDERVSAGDRPEGCVDLGEVTARSRDDDGDGFTSEARGGPDCDDDDASRYPGAEEVWYDGIDSDCGYDDDDDQDGDGHRSEAYGGDDCADTDFWTNPGRVDYCDGRDENCSGDESDASDATTWYQDQDGDSYGADASATTACSSPGAAWVTAGGDCDDTEEAPARFFPGAEESCSPGSPDYGTDYNCDGRTGMSSADADGVPACRDCDDEDPLTYPGANELCDGKDNDCDGTPDDDLAEDGTWYLDYDGDGFGDLDSPYSGCTIPEGYIEDAGAGDDCDDEDASRYPGAPEVCHDGVVQDCEGDEAEAWELCSWGEELNLADADARLIGEESNDSTGFWVSPAGDVDGDGQPDLLVGAALSDAGGTNSGAAYLVLSPVAGDLDLAYSDARMIGEESGDYAGRSLATAGDVDDDGFADLLVGAPESDTVGGCAGAAHLVLGPVTGDLDLGDADAELIGEEDEDLAGFIVSTAGDLDGDGRDDLLVGAPGNDVGGTEAGAAYVVLAPVTGDLDLEHADARLIGERDGDFAGVSASTAGDVDGDGSADLLVGAQYRDRGESNVGVVFLVLGPVTGDLQLYNADARLFGEAKRDCVGCAVSGAGDVDGDGSADLLAGACASDVAGTAAGAAYLVLGPVTGDLELSDTQAQLFGEEEGDYAGSSVAAAGDVDGDAHDDLLVGAPWNDASGSGSGAAYLLLGPLTGNLDLGEADLKMKGEAELEEAGQSVAAAGDVNADGLPDLLIGAPSHWDDPYTSVGAAYLLLSPSY